MLVQPPFPELFQNEVLHIRRWNTVFRVLSGSIDNIRSSAFQSSGCTLQTVAACLDQSPMDQFTVQKLHLENLDSFLLLLCA